MHRLQATLIIYSALWHIAVKEGSGQLAASRLTNVERAQVDRQLKLANATIKEMRHNIGSLARYCSPKLQDLPSKLNQQLNTVSDLNLIVTNLPGGEPAIIYGGYPA
jgi:hypothetical protein